MLDVLDGTAVDEDAMAAFLAAIGPIAPSCRRAKSYLGFEVDEGRGGGILTPLSRKGWAFDIRRSWFCDVVGSCCWLMSDGRYPSEIPIAAKA